MGTIEQINPPPQNDIERASHGIIFAVTAIPTESDGHQGIGGIGETYLAETLALRLTGNKDVLGFGNALRKMANTEAGRKLTETEFEQWRADLAKNGTVEQEHEVDETLWHLAQQQANNKHVVVIAGKLVSYLKATYLQKTDIPAVISIGVTATDKIATLRSWQRKNPKQLYPVGQEIEQEAHARYKRRDDEAKTFSAAYPEIVPNYSRETIVPTLNYAYDNTPYQELPEMLTLTQNFIKELCKNYPEFQQPIIQALAD